VIGTERHESRRIDNQLRGRSGRQGDPGSSRFYLSLEDDLMRIFGGDQIKSLMDRLAIPEDQPIENKLVSRAIEQAQIKVEGFNFDLRKSVVEYDDVANQQREVVYKLRRKVLMADDLRDIVFEKLEKKIDRIILSSQREGSFDYEYLLALFLELVPFDDASKDAFKKKLSELEGENEIREFLLKVVKDVYDARVKQYGSQVASQIDKFAYLSAIDHFWIEHIDYLDSLRENVRLQAYAQKDPLVEFKNEAYNSFESLLEKIDDELTRRIFRIGVMEKPQEIPLDMAQTNVDTSDMMGLSQSPEVKESVSGDKPLVKRVQASSKKIGRNDPCWCGSGKKWKKCHYPDPGPN